MSTTSRTVASIITRLESGDQLGGVGWSGKAAMDKVAAAGWRDQDSLLCTSRHVTFKLERGRTARVLRCPACGSTTQCPLCPLAFYMPCSSCGAGLRYDLGSDASCPSFFALTLLPFPPVEGESGSAMILTLDGSKQTLALSQPASRGPSILIDLDELDDVLPGFSVGHQMNATAAHAANSAARGMGGRRNSQGKGAGPLEFALVLSQSARGRRLRQAEGLPAAPPPLLLFRAPSAAVCSQAVICLYGAYVAASHVPSVHKRDQPVLQGKLLVGSDLLWHDRFLVLSRPAGRTLTLRAGAADPAGAAKAAPPSRSGPWPGPSAWPGPAKLLVFASQDAAVPLDVLPLSADVRILDERPSNFLFALLTRVEGAAHSPADAPGAASTPSLRRAGAAGVPGWTVCEIAAPDQPSKQRWLQAIKEAVREDTAHRPALAAADTASMASSTSAPLHKAAVMRSEAAVSRVTCTLRHASCDVAYTGPRFATVEQLAAAFASRFGDDVRGALARLGPADAPGAHRRHEPGRPLRVGELLFLAHSQEEAAEGKPAVGAPNTEGRAVAFALGELESGAVIVAVPARDAGFPTAGV